MSEKYEANIQDATMQKRTMNWYDLNQLLVAQMKPLDEINIQKAIQKINNFKQPHGKYYMLLCRDLNYYTVFAVKKSAVEDFGSVVIDCARNAGTGDILSVELTEDKTAIEIWINPKPTVPEASAKLSKCMYLFNYDSGICYVK